MAVGWAGGGGAESQLEQGLLHLQDVPTGKVPRAGNGVQWAKCGGLSPLSTPGTPLLAT